jgi:hypothetical protein
MNNANRKVNIWTITELLTVYFLVSGISLFLKDIRDNSIIIYFIMTITIFTVLISLTWKMNTLLKVSKSDKYYRNVKIMLCLISFAGLVTMMILYQP